MQTRLLWLFIAFLGSSLLYDANAQHHQWISLFDGKTLKGWRTYQNRPSGSWSVSNGALYCKANKEGNQQHADLMTEGEFENYEFSIDWKIAPKANSGIIYMVNEKYGASYESGPEYQLIDDAGYPEKIEDYQKTGANYAMDAPVVDATRPAGEWNHTRIIVNKGHVAHWLNGKKVVEYELWSDSWKAHKAAGKWKDKEGYGMSKMGHIALQDHGGEAWFKNIKIRKL
ncbi:DUF1080 domain-containing protein [Asinibacterium sp. OR53]|uniref:3-keto-disaccharide hydrolase n=1 Tax=Asinibacterium sp. OR53 TaxID=925409 RepID=UPI001E603F85|nr:DUF1080 domain-containing protein [Asinibacterium sp. OR53]